MYVEGIARLDGETLKGPQFVLGNGWRRTVFEFWQREQKFRKGQVAQCCEFEAAVEQFGIRRQVKASTLNFAVADRGHQQILANLLSVEVKGHGGNLAAEGCKYGPDGVARSARPDFAFVSIVVSHTVQPQADCIHCPTARIAANFHEIQRAGSAIQPHIEVIREFGGKIAGFHKIVSGTQWQYTKWNSGIGKLIDDAMNGSVTATGNDHVVLFFLAVGQLRDDSLIVR